MKPVALLCAALVALVAFPACERHSAQQTLDFINAHKKHSAHGEDSHGAHDKPDAHGATTDPAHAPGKPAGDPKPFFPSGH